MLRVLKVIFLLLLLGVLVVPQQTTQAHGVNITYQIHVNLIEINTSVLGPLQIQPIETRADETDATDNAASYPVQLHVTSPLEMEMGVTVEVEIMAAFDTGDPMSEGQVSVYTPNDPINPWLVGDCDENGHFTFSPDLNQAGVWEIQVRQAGHGEWLKININDILAQEGLTKIFSGYISPRIDTALQGIATENITTTVQSTQSEGDDSSYSTGQILLMSGSVIWGFIGTALFFSRKSKQPETPE